MKYSEYNFIYKCNNDKYLINFLYKTALRITEKDNIEYSLNKKNFSDLSRIRL